jgi:hypothetical protein
VDLKAAVQIASPALADRALEPLEICFVSSEYPPRMFGGLGAMSSS